METDILDGGRMVVSSKYLALLRANELDTFDRVMATAAGRLKRDFPGRRTSRLELRQPDGGTCGVYLKRYYPEYLSPFARWLRRIGWPGYGDEAKAEWDAVNQIVALNIPTVEVIARGQDRLAGAVRSSFVMTAELAGAEEGHHFAAKLAPQERRQLLRHAARYTRRLHQAGLVHKDLYLCHYMATPAPEVAQLHLIDLQRLTRPRRFVERWRVKDLAALAYSSLKSGATRFDLAAAFRVYRGNQRLDAADRRLARRVWRRINWLKTRTPRHDTDFEQLS
jgi:heptose I phosphotransferase